MPSKKRRGDAIKLKYTGAISQTVDLGENMEGCILNVGGAAGNTVRVQGGSISGGSMLPIDGLTDTIPASTVGICFVIHPCPRYISVLHLGTPGANDTIVGVRSIA